MKKINLRNLDKSDWKPFRFDQIVKNISERVEPGETDLEIYIGLEHIDAESIHIKRFGQPSDVEGQKLKCYPGDVIFGKRRAYQRKASVVTTEAICSAHAFVLRANPEVIDPRLLPFFLHSDLFMHRAVDISAGGLSPTINWSILKIQEFILPPKEQQSELANLFWEMDEVIEQNLSVMEKLKISKKCFVYESFKKANEVKKISELGEVITGTTPSTSDDGFWGGSIPFISPAEIDDSPYIKNYVRFLTEEGAQKSRKIPPNSILTVCIGSTIGKVAINKLECCSNQQINALIPKKQYSSIYILYLLRFHKSRILARTGTTAVPIINKTEFGSIKLRILCEKDRAIFEEIIGSIEASVDSIELKLDSSKALQKSLINEVF
ncbi:restriction endonuclease subunit S [Undibacterium jejuense]|uniref:Restriction endonuclease subunit S n=1 Tax=Undibacterium jejuense TaxID=1344949 RepID=A0A923HK62_9BURK|nr:restriction endonuclease subunit S [Undibacterium jejuense]MBC3863750.1 restriction endonuclease subunit S [Undibacterium jejuense]